MFVNIWHVYNLNVKYNESNQKGLNMSINPMIFTSSFSLDSLTLEELVAIIQSDYDFSDCIVNCSSNGMCKYTGNKTFSCECQANFAGKTCQQDIRPCSHSPCLNNGTCVANNTSTGANNQSYICECSEFYYGKSCEYKTDVCANETCSGNGNCNDENSVATCKCFAMYSGDHCEIESQQKKTIQQVSTTTSIIAIITLVVFYGLVLLSDILDFCCIHKEKFKPTRLSRKEEFKRKYKKPVYIP